MDPYELTKSAYTSGVRCEKLLWLDRHVPGGAAPITLDNKRRFDHGAQVGRRARQDYPNGVLIQGNPFDIERAQRETQNALAAGATTLFEATFVHGGVLAVVDILDRIEPASWHLIEVKSTTNYEAKKHLPDAAVQAHVVRRCGLSVTRVSVQYLNKEFLAPDDGELFIQEDVTAAIDHGEVSSNIDRFKQVLDLPASPDGLIGSQCNNPHECAFLDHCWKPFGKLTVFHLPKTIHHTRMRRLRELGVILLADIPSDFELSVAERAGVQLIRDQAQRIDLDGVRGLLSSLVHPIHFFDFETIDYALPRLPGTRPYQKIPFQFSCHVLHQDGRLEHSEYLHEDLSDPRPPLVDALLATIGAQGSVVAYHVPFERMILKELARDLPHHGPTIGAIIDRFWDLRDVFTGPYQDASFEGSTSIKKILPVLCPDMTYDGMPVPDGTTAMAVWEDVVHGRSSDPERQLDELRAYCEQDTLAMVRLHEELRKI